MKATWKIFFGTVVVIVVGSFLLLPLAKGPKSVTKTAEISVAGKKHKVAVHRFVPSADAERSLAEPTANTDSIALESAAPHELEELAVQIVTHSAASSVWGQFTKTEWKDTLQLTAESFAATGTGEATLVVGTYVSPAGLAHRSFDRLTMDYDAVVPADALLKFEIQTATSNGVWSAWQEIRKDHLKRPIPLFESAAGWRYRMTLASSSLDQTPKIKTVTITTENTSAPGYATKTSAETPVSEVQ